MSETLIRLACFLIGWLCIHVAFAEQQPFGRSLTAATGAVWIALAVGMP